MPSTGVFGFNTLNGRRVKRPPSAFARRLASEQAVGLALWWPMAQDAHGTNLVELANAKTTTLAGTTPGTMWTANDVLGGFHLAFNGTDHYADASTGAVSITKTTAFSVSFWMLGQPANTKRIVSNYNAGTNPGWIVMGLTGSLITFANLSADGAAGRSVPSTTALAASPAWNHIACTNDGSNAASGLVIYVNGVVDTAAATIDTDPGTLVDAGLRIGSDAAGTNFFANSLADVRIYTRALTAAEVRRLYLPDTRWELYL